MNKPEPVEIGHTRHDLRELKVANEWEQKSWRIGKRAYHSQTVHLWVRSCILHHVPVGHPFGKNEKMV